MPNPTPVERLTYLAYQLLFPSTFKKREPKRLERVRQAVSETWNEADATTTGRLDNVRNAVDDPITVNSAALKKELLWLLAVKELRELAPRGADLQADAIPEEVLKAAARRAMGFEESGDSDALTEWAATNAAGGGSAANTKGPAMSTTFAEGFVVDKRNLPVTFDPAEFKRAIARRFKERDLDVDNARTAAHAAYVGGALLRSSYYDAGSPGFDDEFTDVFNRGYERAETLESQRTGKRKDRRLHLEVYKDVAEEVADLKGGKPTIQEVAAVSDEVLDRGPVDDNFSAKARSAFDDFVGQTPVYDSLELPEVVTDETAKGEVVPENCRAVAMVYATGKLENSQLLMAVDTAAQDWSDGVLPVGESAGRLFDDYVWNARDRLDPAARQIQFDRIGELDGYLLRFCSATSELDRSRYLSEYLTPTNGARRSAQPRDASVRKTARDLLAYASLHGWAYTQFAAKRLGNQIRQCVAIIENSEVQQAYSAQSPWQVVERISAMTSGRTPNIAKERTLASTGKEILDLLALKAADIAASLSSDPLFPPDSTQNGRRSVFNGDEYATMLNLVENWLAANAVNDRDRFDAAQPREVMSSPSIPSFGGNGNGLAGFDPETVKNQLMQMVSAGQMPTADQVNQIFGMAR